MPTLSRAEARDLRTDIRPRNDSRAPGLLEGEGSTNNMRNMSLGITAFVVSVGMISVGAQGRNFSGTWVIDSEKTIAAMQAAGETAGAVVARGGGGGGGRGGVVSAGGGGGVAVGGVMSGGGGGVAVARRGDGGGAVAATGGGGGRGGVMVSSDTVIAIDANTFSTDITGNHTSYPLNGTEVSVPIRTLAPGAQSVVATEAKARASWKGDMLVIESTWDSPNGPVTSTTSWFLEGDSLVRLTTRKTYYKRK